MEGGMEVGANCEEVKRRNDKWYNKVDATSVDAYKIPKLAKIMYNRYVKLLSLRHVEFSCEQVSCEI